MEHVFWLVPGVVAGRCGPTKSPWNLSRLRAEGIGAVLSVNGGEQCHPEDFRQLSIRYFCVPLSSNAPPREGDFEHNLTSLAVAYDWITRNEQDSVATLVHCHSGKDRTGLLLAYYLVRRYALLPHMAIATVKTIRPIAFSAEGWQDFASEVLCAIA